MDKKNMRYDALRTARSILRELQVEAADVQEAFKVLDDLNRREPEKVASIWWRQANESQIKKFATEWRKQQQSRQNERTTFEDSARVRR
jgi:hypothetical protein